MQGQDMFDVCALWQHYDGGVTDHNTVSLNFILLNK
mgnify:CR=1 FL=1